MPKENARSHKLTAVPTSSYAIADSKFIASTEFEDESDVGAWLLWAVAAAAVITLICMVA